MDMTEVFRRIDELKPEMIKTLSELISYPSFRREPEEGAPFGRPARDCLERALSVCKELGFKTENVGGYAGVAAIGNDKPLIGVLAHLDVVPAGDGWTKEPFSATLEDGKIYGRGAMDDKGPAVSVMYAMKALSDAGVPLKNGVELIVGTDEECGSSDMRYFKEHAEFPKWLFTPDANYPLINIEKGRVCARFSAKCPSGVLLELYGGRTVNAVPASAGAVLSGISAEEVENAAKKAGCGVELEVSSDGGITRIHAIGVSAHASTPDVGDNALTALIRLLSLLPLDEPARSLICGLDSVFPYGETDGASAGVKASDAESGALTLAFSILDLKDGELSGAADIRFPTCESVESLRKKLSAALSGIGFEAEIGGVEPHCVPADSLFIKELLGAYESVTGKEGKCLAIGGGTYVHGIAGGVAFGCEVDGEDNRIHGADEFIRDDALVENAKIFAEALYRVCNNDSLR